MNFLDFYRRSVVRERRFRDSQHLRHIIDVQGFSLFVHENIEDDLYYSRKSMQEVFSKALKYLGQLGFPKMHMNVVIRDTSDIKSAYLPDGDTEHFVAGAAYGQRPDQTGYDPKTVKTSRKYMAINRGIFEAFNDTTVSVIVHEYAHVYFFNQSKAFKKAVADLYSEMKNVSYKDVKTYGQNISNTNAPINVTKLFTGPNADKYKQAVDGFYRNLLQYYAAAVESGYRPNQTINGMFQLIQSFLTKSIGNRLDPEFGPNEIDHISNDAAGKYFKVIQAAFPQSEYQTSEEIKNARPTEIAFFMRKIIGYRRAPDMAELITHLVSAHKINKTDRFTDPGVLRFFKVMNNWPTSHGLANKDEMFATAIEHFWKLPMDIKKQFIQLMTRH